jgi:hypothetical protein
VAKPDFVKALHKLADAVVLYEADKLIFANQ